MDFPPSVLQTTILNEGKGWEPPVTPHPRLGPSLTFFVPPPFASSLWRHLTSALPYSSTAPQGKLALGLNLTTL